MTLVPIEARHQTVAVAEGMFQHLCEPEDREPEGQPSQAAPLDSQAIGRMLAQRFKPYGANWKFSLFQFVTTAAPFLALLVAINLASRDHYWLSLLLAIPAAGLLVRLFIIQHDCGHGSFFRSRSANDLLGRVLSVVTLTPYGHWRKGHAVHHATSGSLDRRGRGDVEILTVAEYEALSPGKQLGYRLYRNPFIQVLIGAPLNFIILQRIPRGWSLRAPDARRSMLALDAALVVVFGVPMMILGAGSVIATYLPVMVLASWIGNWLFYVQHQFEDAYWERDEDWNFHTAALVGSSYFELPAILQWFSGNIGLHHIHHLSSRVPNYHLQACFDIAPELRDITKRITLRESLKCWRMALWDEQRQMMVGFRDRAC